MSIGSRLRAVAPDGHRRVIAERLMKAMGGSANRAAVVIAQFEKQALVAKLRKARERKKAETGKCGGRKSVAEASPETVALAKKLARYPVDGRKRSLRDIAADL